MAACSARADELRLERGELIARVKDELSLKQAAPLLRKYDPKGKHDMVVDNPATEAAAQAAQQSARSAALALDSLVAAMKSYCTEEDLHNMAAQAMPAMQQLLSNEQLAGLLPNTSELVNPGMANRLINFVSPQPQRTRSALQAPRTGESSSRAQSAARAARAHMDEVTPIRHRRVEHSSDADMQTPSE